MAKHLFQKGNKAALGNPGGGRRPQPATQVLHTILAQIDDPKTNKDKLWAMCEKLVQMGLGYTYKQKAVDKRGEVTKFDVTVPPNLAAISEIFDRIQGKAPMAVQIDTQVTHSLSELTLEELRAQARERGLSDSVLKIVDGTLADKDEDEAA